MGLRLLSQVRPAQNGGWARIEAVGEERPGPADQVSVALHDTIQTLEEWAAILVPPTQS